MKESKSHNFQQFRFFYFDPIVSSTSFSSFSLNVHLKHTHTYTHTHIHTVTNTHTHTHTHTKTYKKRTRTQTMEGLHADWVYFWKKEKNCSIVVALWLYKNSLSLYICCILLTSSRKSFTLKRNCNADQ